MVADRTDIRFQQNERCRFQVRQEVSELKKLVNREKTDNRLLCRNLRSRKHCRASVFLDFFCPKSHLYSKIDKMTNASNLILCFSNRRHLRALKFASRDFRWFEILRSKWDCILSFFILVHDVSSINDILFQQLILLCRARFWFVF